MTSTTITVGIDGRKSCRVLQPPGGGAHSDIFATAEKNDNITGRNMKQHQRSNIGDCFSFDSSPIKQNKTVKTVINDTEKISDATLKQNEKINAALEKDKPEKTIEWVKPNETEKTTETETEKETEIEKATETEKAAVTENNIETEKTVMTDKPNETINGSTTTGKLSEVEKSLYEKATNENLSKSKCIKSVSNGTDAVSVNATSASVPQRVRVPPGGFSSGLW